MALSQAREKLTPLDIKSYASNGLTSGEVFERKKLGLVNLQQFDSSKSLAHILRSNILTLFNGIVGVSFLALLVFGQWQDALFGIPVIFNALIGITQEYRSKRALDRLSLLNSPMARVLRDREVANIKIEEVVVDDLLQLRAGDQLVADAVVIDAQGLEIDESLLTGESEAVNKNQHDLLLSGSSVVSGQATAKVIKISSETYASKITLEARRFSLVKSELRNALRRVILVISIALIPVVAIVINGQIQALGGWDKFGDAQIRVEVLVASVASIISMVPQGLVLITSIAFALAAIKLARQNVLVQELPAVENLARVDVICFDKTGTLTMGEVHFAQAFELADSSPTLHEWRNVVAHFGADPNANATTKGLAKHFNKNSDLSAATTIPFSSTRKWSGFNFENDQGQSEIWILGAPEFLLDPKMHGEILNQAETLSIQGLRVLLLASAPAKTQLTESLPKELIPRVLIAMQEQIRDDSLATLNYFRDEGVSVRIISGDNPSTVAGVARAAGMKNFGTVANAQPIDGRDLPDDIGQLAEIMNTHFIFGRVSPEQKRNMVVALQSLGKVVAMTGDGVNDALALKKADLGIAMGSGSAATKAIARIVLLDSKFSILPGMVAEGRKVIGNIERVARLFLTKTTWAMMLAVAFGILLWRFPYLPRQISAIDAFAVGFPSFALALLPNHERYLPGVLRRILLFSIPAGLVIGASTIILSFLLLSNSQTDEAVAQTSVVLLLSITGLWIVVTLGRPFDRLKVTIIAGCYLLFAAIFCLPMVADFFALKWLTGQQIILPLTISLIACALIELINHLTKSVWRPRQESNLRPRD